MTVLRTVVFLCGLLFLAPTADAGWCKYFARDNKCGYCESDDDCGGRHNSCWAKKPGCCINASLPICCHPLCKSGEYCQDGVCASERHGGYEEEYEALGRRHSSARNASDHEDEEEGAAEKSESNDMASDVFTGIFVVAILLLMGWAAIPRLVPCGVCGEKISSKAKRCPHCGDPKR